MNISSSGLFHKRITAAGVLIAAGIVFGDIGTSPLYTLNAVFHDRVITTDVALGALSAIFWTLFFQTTLKCKLPQKQYVLKVDIISNFKNVKDEKESIQSHTNCQHTQGV